MKTLPLHSHKILLAFLVSCLSACATTQTSESQAHDDWEHTNRKMQTFNEDIDRMVLKPMAKTYLWTTPEPVDIAVTNFFNNLDDIGTAVNDVLQFKLVEGGLDFSRFLVNTTVGVVGLFDVGTQIDLPRHDEDFDQTLGVWGVPMGPYMVLPFVGSSSPRGMLGMLGDAIFHPMTYTFLLSGGAVSIASIGSGVLDVTDTRAGLLSSEKIVKEAAIDRYQFLKSAYIQRRAYLINDGKVTEDPDAFLLDDNFDQPKK